MQLIARLSAQEGVIGGICRNENLEEVVQSYMAPAVRRNNHAVLEPFLDEAVKLQRLQEFITSATTQSNSKTMRTTLLHIAVESNAVKCARVVLERAKEGGILGEILQAEDEAGQEPLLRATKECQALLNHYFDNVLIASP